MTTETKKATPKKEMFEQIKENNWNHIISGNIINKHSSDY